MKNLTLLPIFLLLLFSCQSIAQLGMMYDAVPNDKPLESGTYFIVNNGEALQPLNPMPAQNVFLQRFNKGGMQKWIVTRKISGKKVVYTMRLAGDADRLWLDNYPVKDHTPQTGSGASAAVSFTLKPVAGNKTAWTIHNNRYNGDAMKSHFFAQDFPTEIRYEPLEPGNPKFMWEFVKTE